MPEDDSLDDVCDAGAATGVECPSAGFSGAGGFVAFGVCCPDVEPVVVEPVDEPPAGCDDAGAVAPGLSADPEPLGAGVELASGAAAGFDASFLVKRGGSSPLLSNPTGTSSALWLVFATSEPRGKYVPVPTQGCALPGLLLCSAPFTVNNPFESPDCSASYTVPHSSAIGMGSAL